MESRPQFGCYHAGELPPVEHTETDEEAALLGFKGRFPVVLPREKPQPKKVMLQTDTASGKKFIVVNGKRVEVKEVVRVKQKADKPPASKVFVMNKSPGQRVVKKMNNVETCTEDLVQMKSVCVQTDGDFVCLPKPQQKQEQKVDDQGELPEDDDGYIIREDVRMGQGPKCPTPWVNRYAEEVAPLKVPSPSKPSTAVAKPCTRKERLLQLIKQDYAECVNYDATGNLPIHAAVMENNVRLVMRQCIALKYRNVNVNATNYSNLTPLQLAVFYEADISIFEILLQYGADPSVVDAEGNNIIHLAVMQSKEYILEALLKSVDIFPLGAFNYEGLTPLMICCCGGNIKMASMLLKKQIDPNMRDQKSGRTALFHAVEANDEKMVNLLLVNKADPKVKNFVGMSAHDAVFEIDDLDNNIVLMVLGREQGVQSKTRLVKRRSPTDKVLPGQKKSNVKITVERRYQKCYINNKVRISENGGN